MFIAWYFLLSSLRALQMITKRKIENKICFVVEIGGQLKFYRFTSEVLLYLNCTRRSTCKRNLQVDRTWRIKGLRMRLDGNADF